MITKLVKIIFEEVLKEGVLYIDSKTIHAVSKIGTIIPTLEIEDSKHIFNGGDLFYLREILE